MHVIRCCAERSPPPPKGPPLAMALCADTIMLVVAGGRQVQVRNTSNLELVRTGAVPSRSELNDLTLCTCVLCAKWIMASSSSI